MLRENGNSLFFIEAKGFSMWPFMRGGEQLIVKAIPKQELSVGDIVLYTAEKQLVCHRLIRKDIIYGKRLFFTRGDNSVSSPELVNEDNILGKVVAIAKKSRIIELSGLKWKLAGRVIVIMAPLISRLVKAVKFIFK